MSSERPPKYLTVAETAALLRVSTATIYARITAGTIHHTRIGLPRVPGQRGRGGAIRIPASEVGFPLIPTSSAPRPPVWEHRPEGRGA